MKKTKSSNGRPRNARQTHFESLHSDWRYIALRTAGEGHLVEYFVSPEQKVYRRAFGWEVPTLQFDSPLLPNDYNIRLVFVTSKKMRLHVKKTLKQISRRG